MQVDLRDAGSTPGSGRFHGGGHSNPLQYSCLENPMTEEPGDLQSIGLQRVRHEGSDLARIYVPHRLYPSSVDGRLCCFHILATVNNAAINIKVHVFFSCVFGLLFFPQIHTQEQNCQHTIVLFLDFWEASILFSVVAAPIYISTSSFQGLPFLHILTSASAD